MTQSKIPLIGLTGYARSGKDTFFQFANLLTSSRKSYDCQRFAFADELKKECDDFLKSTLGISAYTSDSKEKEIVRPFLVFWGTKIRRQQNENCWIDKIKDDVIYWMNKGNTAVITDVRYGNEAEWIKSLGGKIVNIIREGVGPANEEEWREGEFMKAYTDHFINWKTYGEDALGDCTPEIEKCFSKLESLNMELV